MASLLLLTLLGLAPVVTGYLTCPHSCDCRHVTMNSLLDKRLEISCFVRDIPEIDMYSLKDIREEYSLNIHCYSGIPIDLKDNMFGEHQNMRSLFLNNCKISFIYKHAFSELQNIEEIKIHAASNHFLQFHPNSLDGNKKLAVLEFTNSGIQQVPTLCFLQNLRILNVTGNSLVDFNRAGLSCGKDQLDGLRTLDISDNYFHNLDELESFGEAFGKVEVVNAARNKIMFSTDDTSFKHFPQLTVLDLSENQITLLPDTLLNINENIQDLRLSDNRIGTIPGDIFKNSRKVLQLELQNNELDDSVWICLSDLKRLLHLDISHNKLTFLNQTTLERVTELGYLRLEGNNIAGIPVRSFQNHQRLQTLNLAGNQIQTIEKEALFGLFYLNKLEIQRNGIYRMDYDVLNFATALNFVNLSSNYLSDLPSMQKLGALTTLDVSDNHISKLEGNSFIGQRKIREINLSNNRISEIEDSIFLSRSSLEVLDLSRNTIKYLHPSLFMGLNIQKLFLQRNQLGTVGKVFADLKQLQELNLSSNKISDTIQRFTFPKSLEMLDCSYNEIDTIRPRAFDGLDHIRMVDLRYNKIKGLSKDALQVSTSLYSQTGFRINNNPLQCDCELFWLKLWDQSTQGPIIVNLNDTWCTGAYNYPESPVKLVPADRFLCPYNSVCDKSCKCCSFTACDCKYECPKACKCYHSSDYYSTHYVKCTDENITHIDRYIPRIATKVDYSGSKIVDIPSEIFIGMENLQTLLLNNSHIKTISDRSFTGLTKLQRIYLNNNYIVKVNRETFYGLEHLQELYLDHNRITQIENGVFDEIASLKVLTLSNNLLYKMTDYLSTFVFGRVDIALHTNPWNCDCVLYFSVLESQDAFSTISLGRQKMVNCSNGINSLTDIREYAGICKGGGGFIPVTVKNFEELTATLTEVDTPEDESENSVQPVRDYEISREKKETSIWNDRLKIFLPAIVAGTIVFIFIILIACRREFVRCWLFTRFRRKSDELELLDDKRRYFDAFVSYHTRDELYVTRELAVRLERGNPKYLLQLQHRDHPPATSELTYIDNSVKSSQRTVIVLSNEFITDNSLLKCVTQSVRHDSLNRLILITLGKIDTNKLDPVLQYVFKQGKRIRYDERWFWDKLCYLLPDPGKTDRETSRAEAHPYACTDLDRLSPAMMDNRAYEEPSSPTSPTLPSIVEYNLPSLTGYEYNSSQNSSNIYEEIKDHEKVSVKYAEPWKESQLREHVHTLTRADRPPPEPAETQGDFTTSDTNEETRCDQTDPNNSEQTIHDKKSQGFNDEPNHYDQSGENNSEQTLYERNPQTHNDQSHNGRSEQNYYDQTYFEQTEPCQTVPKQYEQNWQVHNEQIPYEQTDQNQPVQSEYEYEQRVRSQNTESPYTECQNV